MIQKFKQFPKLIQGSAARMAAFLHSPRSERGEESASVAAITALVLLIILAVMAIFRNALISAFNTIAGLLSF